MSTTLPSTERDNKYILMYSVDVMKARIFGAFLSAAQHRKDAENLTRKMLAEAMCKDEGAVSKLFSSPSNMTIKTIAELCVSLEVELQFALVDKKDPGRVFLDVGMRHRHVHPSQELEPSTDYRTENYTKIEFKNHFGKSHRPHVWSHGDNLVAAPLDNYIVVKSRSGNANRKD